MVTHLGADVTVLATFLSFLSATEEGALMATSPALGQLLRTFRTVTFLGVPCLSSGLPLLQLPSFGGACGVPRLVFTGRGMDAIPPVAMMPPVAPPYCPLRRRWLCYLKHTAGTGWGVHAGRTIPAGTPLLTYTGEVISTEETRRRQAAEYDLGPGRTRNYVLTTREHSCTHVLRTNVDATHVGGVARFVNHSCAPNAYFVHAEARQNHAVPSTIPLDDHSSAGRTGRRRCRRRCRWRCAVTAAAPTGTILPWPIAARLRATALLREQSAVPS